MRFLVDMPLSPHLAGWLKSLGHDAVHLIDRGMATPPDEEIFACARSEERIVLTGDLDFGRLLAQAGTDEPGVILFRGGEYSESLVRERLRAVFDAVPESELPRAIVIVERNRIRLRRLPL